jgi:hypothetical protein
MTNTYTTAPVESKTVVVTTDNLVELAGRIRAAHAKVGAALQHAIEAGNLLMAAKKQVPHGGWLSWLELNCELTERTAQAYMRIAKHLGTLDASKAQRVADLSIRDALKGFSRTANTAKALPAKEFEAVLEEAETKNATAVISDVARLRVNQQRARDFRKPTPEHQTKQSETALAVCLPARIPAAVIRHPGLMERLIAIINTYRAEQDIERADILDIVNEVYCKLSDEDDAANGRGADTRQEGGEVTSPRQIDIEELIAGAAPIDDGIPDFLRRPQTAGAS